MKMIRLLSLAFLVGISAVAAFGDGGQGSDPVGSVHSPQGGGTPPAGLAFTLPPFGTPVGPNSGPCEFVVASQSEQCLFQNVSGVNWTSLTFYTTDSNGCAGVSLSSNVFESAVCVVGANGDAILEFSGVNVTESDPGNGSNPVCTPAEGVIPGVIAGCDFEISLGPSVDPGNWPMDMTTNVAANPEPATIVLMLSGFAGLLFLVVKR